MQKTDIPFLIKKLNELFPNAHTELNYGNEFQLLIAILLSAQTTDVQVNKASTHLFKVLKAPQDGINLGIEGLKEYIKSLGFYNSKSKNVFNTCIILKNKSKNSIPKTLEGLQELPGVGIKTAKVFLALTENAPYIGVDTHVHRVLNRLGLVKTKAPIETDKIISKSFTDKDHANLHHTLVLFGRYYCTARKPKCNICYFKEKCNYYNNKLKN